MNKTDPLAANRLLAAAAHTALRMPKLETMTLWNGARAQGCALVWCRESALLSWRGTWEIKLEHGVIAAWRKVAYEYSRYELRVEKELLAHTISSHGDAVHYLGLHSVVDDISLRQIRRENSCW